MNRFLGRKKTKDGESPIPETPAEKVSAGPRRPSSKGGSQEPPKRKSWKKKKSEPEPEAKLDLSIALPAADSFRTSLIMSNLSTRFSMLRDQDDPLSLIGKASDDSVLAPRRRSRLVDFGFVGGSPAEQDEDSSISSQIRPPFTAQRAGSYSFGDGYGTDDESSAGGSIMSRARPGEGNMLFGGRQKIYRIPIGDAGAVNNLGGQDSRGMRGRALYEDDVSISNFQRYKAEQKAAQMREEQLAQLDRDASMDEMRKDSFNAPPYGYDDRRETVSSTNSGPSMMSQSTAATSVAPSAAASSPGLPAGQALHVEKSRSKKLYEQGLNQHLQDQQAASLGRLASTKRPSISPRTESPYRSASAGNLRDRFEGQSRHKSPSLIAQKPSPTPSLKASGTLQPSTEPIPTLGRQMSDDAVSNDGEKALFQALDPRDRGMATATGRFNRPQKYSDEQFMQRQMSIQKQQKQPSTKSSAKSSPSATGRSSPVGGSPLFTKPPTSLHTRPRTGTNRTDRSWSNASVNNETRAFSATKKIEEQPEQESPISPVEEPESAQSGTFFANDADDESDYEITDKPKGHSSKEQQTVADAPPSIPQLSPARELKHPALRSDESLRLEGNTKAKRQAWSPERLLSGLQGSGQTPGDYFNIGEASEPSPTKEASLTRDEDSNLKGLVREHLRHPSNSSSIYPTARTPTADHAEFDLRVPSMYESHNPWEDEIQPPLPSKPIDSSFAYAPPAVPYSASQSARVDSAQDHGDWREELSRQHGRGDSTETAYENRAFKSELTQRSKIIAENMRVKSPPEQRNGSPLLPQTSRNVFESSKRPFGMLKTRPSRETMSSPRLDQPRPSFASGNSERGVARGKSRGNHTSPPPIGRTLHSKLPRQGEDSTRGPQVDDYSSRGAGPSMDGTGSDLSAPPTRVLRDQTSLDSFRGAQPRHRGSSERPPPDSRDRQRAGSYARPSLDMQGIRRDSGNARSPGPLSAPPVGTSMSSSHSSARMSPVESRRPVPFSAHSTPPLSSVSTPNLINSSTATTASIATQSSAGHQEHSGALPTPSTGFFFPNSSSGPSPVTTPTESSGNVFKKGPLRSRPRKPTISKNDISEPTLIASTTTVDMVDLPKGASLQNGLRDDFDAVLMARLNTPTHDPSAPAPPPSVPMSPSADGPAGGKKKGFFRFAKKDRGAEDAGAGIFEDGYEPKRFRIQRLEGEDGKIGHRTLWAGASPGENGSAPTSPLDGPPGGLI